MSRTFLLSLGRSSDEIRITAEYGCSLEARIGYWPHVEFDWTDAVRTAGELRAEHSLKMAVRAMDLFHIAIAIEVGAEALLSFDTDQIAPAKAAGLTLFDLARSRK